MESTLAPDKALSEVTLPPTMTVEQALARLGSTVDEVAESLKGAAAGARYTDIFDCAICRYLRGLGFPVVSASCDFVRIGSGYADHDIVPFPNYVTAGIMKASGCLERTWKEWL